MVMTSALSTNTVDGAGPVGPMASLTGTSTVGYEDEQMSDGWGTADKYADQNHWY